MKGLGEKLKAAGGNGQFIIDLAARVGGLSVGAPGAGAIWAGHNLIRYSENVDLSNSYVTGNSSGDRLGVAFGSAGNFTEQNQSIPGQGTILARRAGRPQGPDSLQEGARERRVGMNSNPTYPSYPNSADARITGG